MRASKTIAKFPIPSNCSGSSTATLVVFEQYNANAAPGNARNSEMELRGTKGHAVHPVRELAVVPEKIADAYTGYDQGTGYGNPVNRDGGSRVAASLKTVIEPKTVQGRRVRHHVPHPQFPRLHQDPQPVQRRRLDRSSFHLAFSDRQHRP
jgi:hypothetical protein